MGDILFILAHIMLMLNHSVMSDSCNPMDCSPPGSSVHGIAQERIVEGVAISFSRESFQPRNQTQVSYTAGRFFTLFSSMLAPRSSKHHSLWGKRESILTSGSSLLLNAFIHAMAPHSSVLAWRIPGTGEPGELPSMGSHRVGHD